jgi:gamma-tubulin complex component 2
MVLEVKKDKDQPWQCWEEKYDLRREQVPSLFEKDAHTILVTGKYLNVVKACSGFDQHPLHKEIEKNIEKHIKNQDFTEDIMRAYNWANEKLQDFVLKKLKLEEVLTSVKGYFFLGFGDLFVHFMDSAEDDLNAKNSKHSMDAKAKPISVDKLQNLFELLIRTSSANGDPYKEAISCKL